MKRLRIGIVGCGAMGRELARSIETRFFDSAVLEALCDVDGDRAKALADELRYIPQLVGLTELVEKVDLVIEVASIDVVPQLLELAAVNGRDLMVMSVGGLIGQEKAIKKAKESGVKIHVPSGAIGGLDALRAAFLGGIDEVKLITTKHPLNYEGAPYVLEHNIDLKSIDKETVLFEGPAQEAIKGFPKNVNVSAILSYYGIGPKKTRVKMVASPTCECNSHEIEVAGPFGKFMVRMENRQLAKNPKTSMLAPLSAIAMLKEILAYRSG